MFQWRANEKVKGAHPTISKPWGLAANVTKLLVSASLTRQAPNKTNTFRTFESVDMAKVKEQFAKRETTDVFAEDKFEGCMKLCADGFNARD